MTTTLNLQSKKYNASDIASLPSHTEYTILMKYWHTLSKDQEMWHIFREHNADGSLKHFFFFFFFPADITLFCPQKMCYIF